MSISRHMAHLALACCALLSFSAAAHAQASLRFVSSTGKDANNCGRTQPCRSLQRAVDVAAAGSTIMVLDTAGYGRRLSINKSLSILAEGVTATLLARDIAGAITIDAPGATVVLQGLTVTGGDTGSTGIRISEAAAVQILDCEVERFGTGIQLTSSAGVHLFVKDTIVRNNRFDGLDVNESATVATKLTVEDSVFENNGGDGMDIRGNAVQSTLTRTLISGNQNNGVLTGGRMIAIWTTAAKNVRDGFNAGGGSDMTLEFSVARGNGDAGLIAFSGSTARISNSVFTDNDVGVQITTGTGVILTRQNNTISGNSRDVLGTLTPLGGR